MPRSLSDIIALLVVSVVLISLAVAWQYYLEFKTNFPPILRMSILSRRKGTVGILLFVTVCFSLSTPVYTWLMMLRSCMFSSVLSPLLMKVSWMETVVNPSNSTILTEGCRKGLIFSATIYYQQYKQLSPFETTVSPLLQSKQICQETRNS